MSPDRRPNPDRIPTGSPVTESRLPTHPFRGWSGVQGREDLGRESSPDPKTRGVETATDLLEDRPGTDPVADARESLEAALDATCEQLGDEELRVLVVLARRLLAGQRAYGRLDLANDRRDFRRERAEELADAMVYDAVHEVAATLRGGRP